ncbi:MAG: thermonuclease family protein [Rhodospirillales bacterium]|nr:thermonuclease family protein [Rhodospirillales bacterium]
MPPVQEAAPIAAPMATGHAFMTACDPLVHIDRVEPNADLRLVATVNGASVIRLAGVDLPQLGDSGLAAERAPLIDETRAVMAAIEQHSACLEPREAHTDRYGRLPVQVFARDGAWLQASLLRLGLARVRPTADSRPFIAEMLSIEAGARARGVGLWREPEFAVRRATDPGPIDGSYQIVEGRVTDASRHGNRWYINFGDDWRDDFTVIIPVQALKLFEAAGMKPYSLKGRDVRVRGWVETLNGPMIEALLPEQIELTDGGQPTNAGQ